MGTEWYQTSTVAQCPSRRGVNKAIKKEVQQSWQGGQKTTKEDSSPDSCK